MKAVDCVPRARLLLLATLLVACADKSGPPGPSALQASDVPATAAVGSTLTPAVTVVDNRGQPVANVVVTFAVTGGGGSIAVSSVTSGATGTVSPGTWTLGTQPGANSLTASTASVSPVTLTVQTMPDVPSSIQQITGGATSGTVGQNLPVAPGVTLGDRFGNPVPGAVVTFTASAGTVVGGTQTTNAAGQARATGWQLGTTAGPQSWTARSGQASASFQIEALAAAPSELSALEGTDQTAPIGFEVAVRPAVTLSDAFGNAARNAPVTFSVTSGGGTVLGGSTVTDVLGVARVQSWRLGMDPGENVLTVTSPGVTPITIRATAETRPPFEMVKAAGDNTTCPANSAGCSFSVRVFDIMGAPAPGQAIRWTHGSGATTTTTTNVQGFATASNLGPNAGTGQFTQTARLESTGEEQSFSYSIVQGGGYQIDIRVTGAPSESIQAAFDNAARRWEQVVTGNLPGGRLVLEADACGIPHAAVDEIIDDLLIFVDIVEIDGPGNTLGAAGPCIIRDSNLPAFGLMRLDVADLALMEDRGILRDVILHEIGHILGLGPLWHPLYFNFVQGRGGPDPRYMAARGVSAFQLGGGHIFDYVHVEGSAAGPGSADSHWREAILGNELMTSSISTTPNPLSAITIAALLDMGYQVNFGAADPYVRPGSALQAQLQIGADAVRLIELPMPPPRRW
jgi:hypothetical protein